MSTSSSTPRIKRLSKASAPRSLLISPSGSAAVRIKGAKSTTVSKPRAMGLRARQMLQASINMSLESRDVQMRELADMVRALQAQLSAGGPTATASPTALATTATSTSAALTATSSSLSASLTATSSPTSVAPAISASSAPAAPATPPPSSSDAATGSTSTSTSSNSTSSIDWAASHSSSEESESDSSESNWSSTKPRKGKSRRRTSTLFRANSAGYFSLRKSRAPVTAVSADALVEHLRSHGDKVLPIPANQLDFPVLVRILGDVALRHLVDTRTLQRGQVADLPEEVLLTSQQVPESFLDAYRNAAAKQTILSYSAERQRQSADSPAETFEKVAAAARQHLHTIPEARMVVNVVLLKFFDGLDAPSSPAHHVLRSLRERGWMSQGRCLDLEAVLLEMRSALATRKELSIAKFKAIGELDPWHDPLLAMRRITAYLDAVDAKDRALLVALLVHPQRASLVARWATRVKETKDLEPEGLLLGLTPTAFAELAASFPSSRVQPSAGEQGNQSRSYASKARPSTTTSASSSTSTAQSTVASTNAGGQATPTPAASEGVETKVRLTDLSDTDYIKHVGCRRTGCNGDHPYYHCSKASDYKLEKYARLREKQLPSLKERDVRLFPKAAIKRLATVPSAPLHDLDRVTSVLSDGSRKVLQPSQPKSHLVTVWFDAGAKRMEVNATIDTGSSWTLISEGLATELGLTSDATEPITVPVVLADGSTVTLTGPAVMVSCEVSGLKGEQKALIRPDIALPERLLVSNGLAEALGLSVSGHVTFCTPASVMFVVPEPARAFQLPSEGLTEAVPLETQTLLDRNASTSGATDHVVSLPWKDPANPPQQSARPRQGTSKYQGIIREEHRKLLQEGKVVPCEDPKWVSTYHIVEQTSETGEVKHRLVYNFQALNENLVVPPMDLDINSMLTTISTGKFYAKLDGKSAYLQLAVEEKDQDYLCYEFEGRFYKFKYCPFGLANMPAAFQKFATDLCDGLKVMVYLDDFVLFGDSVEEVQQTLQTLLERCNKANYRLSVNKSVLCSRSLVALGRIVTHGRVSPDPTYLSQVGEIPLPRTLRQLRMCLGSYNWVADYIVGAAQLAAPLFDLAAAAERESLQGSPTTKAARKKAYAKHLAWTPELVKCFEKLIASTKAALAISTLDPTKKLTVYIDASTAGYGAVLLQEDDSNILRVVGLVSKKFTTSQVAWTVHRKETYALMAVVTRYWPFMRGASVYTDHSALVDLVATPDNTRIVNGWIHVWASSGATLHFVEGYKNAMADWLSRIHGLDEAEVTPLVLMREANLKASAKGLRAADDVEALASSIAQRNARAKRSERRQAITELVAETAKTKNQLAPDTKFAGRDTDADIMDRWNALLEPAGLADSPTAPQLSELPTTAQTLTSTSVPTSTSTSSSTSAPAPLATSTTGVESTSANSSARDHAKEEVKDGAYVTKILEGFPHLRLKQVDDVAERQRLLQETHARIAHRDARTLTMAIMTIHESWWPTLARDCRAFHSTCNVCAAMNPGSRVFAPSRPVLPSEPMALLGMDIKGPLRKASDGSQYILVLVDYCSSYVIALPIPDIESATIEKELRHLFMMFGFPQAIMSDNASTLKGEVDTLLTAGGVKRLFSIPYLPRTNGKVEAAVKIISNGIAKLAEDEAAPGEWPERARIAATAYNEVVRAAAGCSPFQLMFGRRFMSQQDSEKAATESDSKLSCIDWRQVQLAWKLAMDDHRRYTLPAARDGEIELKKKVAAATDASHRTNGENFANDTLVKIRMAPGEDSKWSKETFKVHGMNSHGAYVLVDSDGKVVERLFARDQLKRTSAFAVQKKESPYSRITAKEYKNGATFYTVIRKDSKLTETVPASGVNDALVKEFEARVRRANKVQA